MWRFTRALYLTTEKIGAYVKILSIAFVFSIIDTLQPCAELSSLMQFVTVFHLPTIHRTLPMSPSTLIRTANFSDGQATSSGLDAICPSPMKILACWVDNPRPLGCPQIK
jgi:hypothetical protein